MAGHLSIYVIDGLAKWPELTDLLDTLGYETITRNPPAADDNVVKLAVVSPRCGDAAYRRALRAGADSVLTVGTPLDQLQETIEAAHAGWMWLPAAVAHSLSRQLAEPDIESLSDREQVLLHRTAQGSTVAQIACELAISERHVRRLLHNLWTLLGANNRHSALVNAARWGLLEKPHQTRPDALTRPTE